MIERTTFVDSSTLLKLHRVWLLFCYLAIGSLISIAAMNDTTGSMGPFAFTFSWGSFFFLVLARFVGPIRLPGIVLLAVAIVAVVGYLASIVAVNGRFIGIQRRLPYVALIYHFTGIAAAYHMRGGYYEEAGKSDLCLFIYPTLIALGSVYIFLDWRATRKLRSLKIGEETKVKS